MKAAGNFFGIVFGIAFARRAGRQAGHVVTAETRGIGPVAAAVFL
jgi:hypothetical protein